jgi:D-beta-D-heptose 7-phosphate kinase/D-beta-D-heptose 1-phosphate adenosyltransferase
MDHRTKIMTWTEAETRVKALRAAGGRFVFTNGCFDILHLGHLRYLAEARGLGDFLLVGLNSDASVRTIKDPRRPIVPEDQRAEMLAGLTAVDAVVLFDEPDPLALITLLQPDVLVKGGDWTPDRIIGRDVVEARGGRVLSIPLTPGLSTSNLIDRILDRYRS